MLRQPFRDVGIEHVRSRVQQRAEESHPPFADTSFVAQKSPFLVADTLLLDLLCLLQLHRFNVLEVSVLISRAQLLLQLNDVALKKTNDCCTRTLFSQLHAFRTALRSCASLVSIFRRCHAVCIASVAACSSASVRASPLQPRLSLLPSWSGITDSAVRMMAAANAASTSSTLLSPGGFALRCLPTAVTTSCRS